jgi:hypothetical protein
MRKGNPPCTWLPHGLFWSQVLERRDYILDILGHYKFLERRSRMSWTRRGAGMSPPQKSNIFPRYQPTRRRWTT